MSDTKRLLVMAKLGFSKDMVLGVAAAKLLDAVSAPPAAKRKIIDEVVHILAGQPEPVKVIGKRIVVRRKKPEEVKPVKVPKKLVLRKKRKGKKRPVAKKKIGSVVSTETNKPEVKTETKKAA